jgi:hypothetical protein
MRALTASSKFSGWSAARASKETALATLRELQVEERTNELVRRSAVADREFRVGRRVRDGLQNLSSRLAGLVAAETSQQKCFELIEREVQQCLEGLTDEKDTTEEGHTSATSRP